jgi:hypothetical protein
MGLRHFKWESTATAAAVVDDYAFAMFVNFDRCS